MAGSPTKRARRTREQVILSEPDNALALICGWMAEGKHLTAFCREYDISYNVIHNWLDAEPSRRLSYARAREAGADAVANLAIDTLSTIPNRNNLGNVDPGHVSWLKNKADGLKWMAGKLQPTVYGDKVDVTSKGESVNPVVAILMAVQGTALPVIPQGVTIDMDDDDDD